MTTLKVIEGISTIFTAEDHMCKVCLRNRENFHFTSVKDYLLLKK